MNLHEYQAKKMFQEYGLPIPQGQVCDSAEGAVNAATSLGGNKWVIKCQVHAGGRGKAGGVELVNTKDGLRDFAHKWLGKNLVTYQTDVHGQIVNKLLIEACSDIGNELYLGAVIDRASQRVTFMASTEGGVEIEKVAEETPELIHTVMIDPLVGAQPYQGRALAFKLGLSKHQIGQFTQLFLGLAKIFQEKDLSLLEINPLVVTKTGDLICLDGKVSIDSNAMFRQKELHGINDISQGDEREVQAEKWELTYVSLDGNIGCMVNGAGLAMGTMDIVQLHGGKPANFLDVGGSATKERVIEAFKIILSDTNVKAILVNIFGGIVRCDLIANGIIGAIKEVGVSVPVIARLEGNNAELALEILAKSDLNIIAATSLENAADEAVAAAGGK